MMTLRQVELIGAAGAANAAVRLAARRREARPPGMPRLERQLIAEN